MILKNTPENSPARVLYNWIQSEDGQNLVRNEGYATAEGTIPENESDISNEAQALIDAYMVIQQS